MSESAESSSEVRGELFVPCERPIDLLSTLRPLRRGIGDPTFVSDAGAIWLTRREVDGVATLALSSAARGVRALAWGSGGQAALAAVPRLIGVGDDWSTLDLTQHRWLAAAQRRNPGLRLTATGQVFQVLVPAILEQKVTTRQSWGAWRALVRAYGTRAPGPHPGSLMVVPTPAEWRAIPSWEWRRAGVDEKRAETIRRAASRADAIDRTGREDPVSAEHRLLGIRGVGPWTCAETLARSHGAPDVVSVGDFHLARSVGTAFEGRPVDDARMLELLEPWRGQRQRILRLIGAIGVMAERHGPRLGVPDHIRSFSR